MRASTRPRAAPTKKIPYIDDGGTIIGDSGLIVDHLKKKYGDALDAKLTADQRALGHLLRRTLEESLYFVGLYARWVEAGLLALPFAERFDGLGGSVTDLTIVAARPAWPRSSS